MEEESKSIWAKKPDDLTTGDTMIVALVYTVAVTAAMAAPFVLYAGGVAVKEKVQKIRENRKSKKLSLVK